MTLLLPVLRWLFMLLGAAVGSYAGRVAAAALRGEPVQPLLRVDMSATLRQDVVPGVVAVEIVGRLLKLGPWGTALVAAAAAAAAAFAEGPLERSAEVDRHATPQMTAELGRVG